MSAKNTENTEVLVIGAGPAGYTAAFRAADLGKKVTLVEYYDNLGGVCLNVGCIPSKALLHRAKMIEEAAHLESSGISFGKPKIDIKKIRTSIEKEVLGKLTMGIKGLAKQRKVNVVQGNAQFISANAVEVTGKKGKTTINFINGIIAVGSRPVKLPFLPDDSRIMDSTGALELQDLPESMLVLGGGIIGMELGSVYQAFGSKVSVVELTDGLIPGADKDLVMPLQKRLQKKFSNIYLGTKLVKVEAKNDGLYATFEGKNAPSEPVKFDKILSAVGRVPNGNLINADKAGIKVDERGFIPVDKELRTNVTHIFAVGDVAQNPMLAHKGIAEARVAAEVIAGKKHKFDVKCIPSVCYTNPEIAWVGVTETEAKQQKLDYAKGVFPWMACGRALATEGSDGISKVIIDKASNRIIGGGIVGPHAGDLISEIALAIEMGCDAEDVALTIHPHPTFAETVPLAIEVFDGTVTDLYVGKK